MLVAFAGGGGAASFVLNSAGALAVLRVITHKYVHNALRWRRTSATKVSGSTQQIVVRA